ncbi:PREDICTED: WD repeat-containing protein 17-like [Priapulus caudatus]|uniref:WD repeat-containing protein 17-like n=1 Tax=Priapulus caudatus TaxID=37621 RepID=A0ABM1EK13_PRICU|nr:PREDICTED: WD repeat-containing protein 17-like [Priapulus caudatus]
MAALKQVSLLTAGSQPWNRDVCACTQDRFAYCSTLAVYVYMLDERYSRFKLSSIVCEHKKTITALAWSPHDPTLLATSGTEQILIVYSVAEHRVVAKLNNTQGIPVCIGWCPYESEQVAFVHDKGPLYVWNYGAETPGLQPNRDTNGFQSNVSVFRYHHSKIGTIAFGHADGTISICNQGHKTHKHILNPCDSADASSSSATDAETNPVHDISWDPLSNDYLLVAHLRRGLHLVDVVALTFVMKFELPSAGAHTSTLKPIYYTRNRSRKFRLTLKPVHTSPGNEGIIYHLSWAPADLNCVAAATARNGCIIWDVGKGKVIKRFLEKSNLFKACIRERLYLRSLSLSSRHGMTVDASCDVIFLVTGHTAKVFSVRWSPLREGILCSGADDKTIRVWDYTQATCAPGGATNLWNLVSVVSNGGAADLPESYARGIVHLKHMTSYKASEASQLEMVSVARFGSGGVGARGRDECLQDAAAIYLWLGNVQRYCEMLVGLGEWEKALAVAPGVSMEYWTSLAKRRAEQLSAEDSEEAVPYLVATGDAEAVVEFYASRSKLHEAMLSAAVAREGRIRTPRAPAQQNPDVADDEAAENEESHSRLLGETVEALGELYFQDGSPTLAACCHLAVDNYSKAMCKLIRGNELELAVCVGTVLGTVPDLTAVALSYLSRRCERLDKWEVALSLLKTSAHTKEALAELCIRCSASSSELDDLHKQASLPSLHECLQKAEQLSNLPDGGDGRLSEERLYECVRYYLLSSSPETGLEMGLSRVAAAMGHADWTADDVWPIVRLLGCMRTDKLQHPKCGRLKAELLLVSAYVGALVAIRRRYDSIVTPLFICARHIISRMEKTSIPLTISLVDTEVDAWKAHRGASSSRNRSVCQQDISREQQRVYAQLLRKTGRHDDDDDDDDVEKGPVLVSSSHLPSHSDVRLSYLDGEQIQGPVFYLEDGQSAVSLNDALMWAKVNAFSPLGSAVHINPF